MLLASFLTIALSIPAPHLAGSSIAIAAPVPTPTAASATLLAPPNPNPIPFLGAPNQQLLSGQYNSNFYAVVQAILTLETALNTTYTCPTCFTSASNNSPAALTVGSTGSGPGGAGLVLGLAHGTDYDDTSTAQTIAGMKTYTTPIRMAQGYGTQEAFQFQSGTSSGRTAISATNGNASAGVTGSAFAINNSGVNQLVGVDVNGNLGTVGSIYSGGNIISGASSIAPTGIVSGGSLVTATQIQVGPATPSASNYIVRGNTGTYPYVLGEYNGLEHIKRGDILASTTAVQVNGLAFTSSTTYSCALGLQQNGSNTYATYARNSGDQISITTAGGSLSVSYVCVGN